MLTFITGGIKSGKSVFAEKLAEEQLRNVYYVATAVVTDSEMQKRVEIHRNRRPSHWNTIEESYDLKNIFDLLPRQSAVVLVDCLTTLLTNILWKDHPYLFENDNSKPLDDELIDEMKKIAEILSESQHQFIIVSNEVGLGLIPPTKIGRIFCDLQGKVNQVFAEIAESVYFTISGIPVKIKSKEGIIKNI